MSVGWGRMGASVSEWCHHQQHWIYARQDSQSSWKMSAGMNYVYVYLFWSGGLPLNIFWTKRSPKHECQKSSTTIMEGWRSDFLYKLVLLVVNVPSNWTWYYLILHPLIAFCTAWNYCSREVRSSFHVSTSTRTQPAIPIFCTIIPLISHLSRRAKALFPVGWSADNRFVQHKG